MRLHRYGVNTHTAPDGKTVISATLWYENRDDMTGNIMSGNFQASAEEYNAFLTDEITSEELIKEKIAKLLDLNADADTELAIQAVKDQVLEVELNAEKAVESQAKGIRKEMETAIGAVVEEATTQATQKAAEAVGEHVAQLGAEIEKATAAVAQIATIKAAIRKLLPITEMAPEDIAELVALYEPWEVGDSLKVGDIRSYDGKLWEVLQAHTTQGDWIPATVPALFKEVAPAQTEEGEEIVPEWKQPTGAHDAYKIGDKVLFEGKIYQSLIGANTWSPIGYPQGWEEVTE